jgi:hypothetical protein
MGLQRFERGLERLVEGMFAKAFRSGLQPVELGRRLTREMDLRRTVGVSGLVAPNHFTIILNSFDNEKFSNILDALRRELVEIVREHARSERYTFLGPVSVVLDVDSQLTKGMFLVNSEFQEQPGGGLVGVLVLPDGRRIDLGDKPATIGRLPDCDVALADPNVSRKHAEIRRSGTEYVIYDLGSTNGTKVNGTYINGERRLRDGDEITIGAAVIKFEGP